jgi:hypothetical protein
MLVLAAIVVFVLYRKHKITVGTTTPSAGAQLGTVLPSAPVPVVSAGNSNVLGASGVVFTPAGPVVTNRLRQPISTLSGRFDS